MASGALLTALVGWSLVATAGHDRDRAALDARTAAHDLALSLRTAVRQPDTLELTPPSARFAILAGSLQVDAAIGWLQDAPAAGRDAVVDGRRRAAETAEFQAGDAIAAAAIYDELLGEGLNGRTTSLPMLAAAAWQAHRADDRERTATLTTRLDGALAAVTPAALGDRDTADATASAALLAAARGLPFAAGERLLPALPPDLATATLQRLAERGADTAALASAHAAIAARRDLLREVAAHLRDLGDAPQATALGERLLLWLPGAVPGFGRGALLAPTFLQSLREHQETAGRGELAFANPPRDADEVIPRLAWVAPAALPERPWLTRPVTVLGATLSLVAVFAASLALAFRAQRREALATRARAAFVTGVTHELKTPVASIRLIADVLQTDDVPPHKQREYCDLLAGEAMRLSTLVDNVLDLGQRERGERAWDQKPGDLAETVRTAVRLFVPLARESGVEVVFAEDLPPCAARFDREALLQALRNVLENARKYAADGHRIEIALQRTDEQARIAVRDFGCGVAAGERDTIFAQFARGARHRHGSVPGLGIGLHLARAIARGHGGDLVCAAPATGPGAQFVFTLPLQTGAS